MLSGHYTPLHTLGEYPLLPTPPSSPPTIGMHPVESTIALLESLVAFYHQERMWVYRTRAQLEMGLFNKPDSTADADLDGESTSSPDSAKSAESTSPPTKWLKRKKAFNLRLEGISSTRTVARGGISKHQHRTRQCSNLNPASHAPSSAALHPYPPVSIPSSNTATSFYPPTAINPTVTLTSPYLSHPSLQFAPTQPPPTLAARYVSTPTTSAVLPSQSQPGPLVLGAGGREPTVQILEMFERMMQARMESCERVTRMVREASKPGGIGANVVGSVGGPVGGFGGPVGLPVGIGPQGIIGSYQGTTEGQNTDLMLG